MKCDWENIAKLCATSSPAWGRGLKSIGRCILEMSVRSSPAWGRGLK